MTIPAIDLLDFQTGNLVGVPGNETADDLAGRGCDLSDPISTVLTHSEIHSIQTIKMNLTCRNPPTRHWYAAKSSGLSIQCRSSGLIRRPWRTLEAVICVV
ncbi:hypothetical protein TNCV_2255741 [Trichonephila clavipes]|nr:hypothetical protein TNCV_2255741 [Trichonephila clavipes]